MTMRRVLDRLKANPYPAYQRPGEPNPRSRIARCLAGAALYSLAACASTPAVRTETVEVATPIPVACVAAKDIPNEPALIGKLPTDARAALDLTAAKLIEVRLYGRTLAALLKGCTE